MNKTRDTATDPPPVGSGDVWAWNAYHRCGTIAKSSDVRTSPNMFPRWRPLNKTREKTS